jgi:hypothetical protein
MKRIILFLLLATATAYARPGSSGFSSGGGGGYHPSSTFHTTSRSGKGENLGAGAIIAIILGVGIFVVVLTAVQSRRQRGTTLHVASPPPKTLDFTSLRSAVPSFSRFLFEDTAADLVRTELARRHEAKPETVLVADIRPTNVTSTHITCTIEASIAGTYNVGAWTFQRTGDNTFRVDDYKDVSLGRGPQLVSTGPEIGNDLPTLTDEQAIVRFTQLRDEDTSTSWDAFTARVKDTYAHLNEAWNTQELAPVDGYATPRMLEWLRFWYAEYKRQGLVNHHADAEVRHVGLAQVTREANLDAVTVRVYAAGHDFTTRAGTTDMVAGSQTVKREYTEYWTFVRSKGAPSWLLTKIEQDELYAG